jgi:hypothetical protein
MTPIEVNSVDKKTTVFLITMQTTGRIVKVCQDRWQLQPRGPICDLISDTLANKTKWASRRSGQWPN